MKKLIVNSLSFPIKYKKVSMTKPAKVYVTKIEKAISLLKSEKESLKQKMFEAAYKVDINNVLDYGGQQTGMQIAINILENIKNNSPKYLNEDEEIESIGEN